MLIIHKCRCDLYQQFCGTCYTSFTVTKLD